MLVAAWCSKGSTVATQEEAPAAFVCGVCRHGANMRGRGLGLGGSKLTVGVSDGLPLPVTVFGVPGCSPGNIWPRDRSKLPALLPELQLHL